MKPLLLVTAALASIGWLTCEGSPSSHAQSCAIDADCAGAVCQLGRCVERAGSPLTDVHLDASRDGEWLHRGRSPFALGGEGLERVFRHELGARVVAAPCLLPDGRALVVTVNGHAFVLDAAGAVHAERELGIEVLSTPAVDLRGRILVAASDGALRVLDASLRELARGSLGDRVEGPITRLPVGLFAVPTRGIALVTAGAVELRRIPTPTVLRAGVTYHPDGFVVVGTPEGRLVATRLDGTQVFDADAGASIDGAAAVADDGSLLVGNDLGQLLRFDRTGSRIGRFEAELDVRATPTVLADGKLLVTTLDGHARLLDAALAPLTDLATAAPIEAQALLDARGHLVFGGHDGRLHLLSPDGHEQNVRTLGADVHTSPRLMPDGTLIVVADDGALHGFR